MRFPSQGHHTPTAQSPGVGSVTSVQASCRRQIGEPDPGHGRLPTSAPEWLPGPRLSSAPRDLGSQSAGWGCPLLRAYDQLLWRMGHSRRLWAARTQLLLLLATHTPHEREHSLTERATGEGLGPLDTSDTYMCTGSISTALHTKIADLEPGLARGPSPMVPHPAPQLLEEHLLASEPLYVLFPLPGPLFPTSSPG